MASSSVSTEVPYRRCFDDIDINVVQDKPNKKAKRIDPNTQNAAALQHALEDLKTYTFTIGWSPIQVQFLSTNTLGDLLEFMFGETAASSHPWRATIGDGQYELGYYQKMFQFTLLRIPTKPCFTDPKTKLKDIVEALQENETPYLSLQPVLGSISTKSVQYLATLRDTASQQNSTNFPFEIPEEPAPHLTFQTKGDKDLDGRFSSLSSWCFADNIEINLFQAGQKRIYAFLQRPRLSAVGNDMILIADKPNSLYHYLLCLEEASAIDTSSWTWQSVVVFPKDDQRRFLNFLDMKKEPKRPRLLTGSNRLLRIYDETKQESESSLCLDAIFPKLAALAGHRKDKKVKRGWIRYKDGVLMVCSGTGSPVAHPRSPKGTAFHGEGCHLPSGKDKILFRYSVKLRSLQELFCLVEQFLGTL